MDPTPRDRDARADALARLDRLSRRAGLILGWERLWPPLVAALAIVALFLAVSFLGLWLESPRWGRIAGSAFFGLALAIALARLARLALPARADRLARIDRDSGLAHRPATTLDDNLANGAADVTTRALWRAHQRRAEEAAANLKLAAPSPRMATHDRYALRAAALLALAGAAFVAGPEKYARVLAAFDWRTPGALSAGYRLDAWIDPPGYTGRPPIVINLRDENAAAAKDAKREFSAPVGSTVIVRASAGSNISAEGEGGLKPLAADDATAAKPASAAAAPGKPLDEETRLALKGDGKLVIKRFGSMLATFALTSIPDKPPTIEVKGTPKANARGSLTVGYKIDDDYGVIGAEASFASPVVAGKPVAGRTLVEPPKMTLQLPAGPGGLGEGETTADLSEHAWAGARVTMTLTAKDEGGNEGRSAPVEITLPQRTFTKPLARALVEQRRNLILAPDDHGRVTTSIDALSFAPDKFGVSDAIYLGLRAIAARLANARDDAGLLEAADLMWEMALRIEDGNVSEAERDLRAAEQALRDAMQRGASDEELKALMDQLRAAMDKFLNEMARNAQQNQDAQRDQQTDPNARTVTPQQLQSMLDRMQEMMKNGQMAEAQRMLEQLQNMMENLQTARPQGRPDPMAREMNRALDELDQLSREEQELRDKTFRGDKDRPRAAPNSRDGRDQRQAQRPNGRQQQQGQRGQQGQQGQQGGQQDDDQAQSGDQDGDQMADNGEGDSEQSLAERQQNLRQRLENLKKRMQQFGMDGKDGLDDAEQAMREAEGELGKGQQGRGRAVDAEGRAIEALRKQSQQLAQQMQQNGQQMGQGRGRGQPQDGQPREGTDNASDPLGRESHDRRDNNQQRFDPLGVAPAQRAQRVIEELRKRLGDPNRPREELDYLERLMKPY